MHTKKTVFIGAALGWGAQKIQTAQGPDAIQSSSYITDLINTDPAIQWQATIRAPDLDSILSPVLSVSSSSTSYTQRLEAVTQTTQILAQETAAAISNQAFPIIIGGDHSMAIGTWSGIVDALDAQQAFGLIWFDAHMDAHTPQTSPSMAIHGMPVAVLLGYGEASLVNLQKAGPKIDPMHLVLMGIRSFEAEEEAFLKKCGVTIFYMHDIQARGFKSVCEEALGIVTKNTKGFGLSIDIDGFDPLYVPGTGSHAPDGLAPDLVLPELSKIMNHPLCRALEIAEFNPSLDIDERTLGLIENIIKQKIMRKIK